MTARARVDVDWMMDGVAIHMAPSEGVVLSFNHYTHVPVPPDTQPTEEVQPLRLRDDVARALFEALAEHYGGLASDQRLLRRDYEAERARVDRLTDAVITIAKEA